MSLFAFPLGAALSEKQTLRVIELHGISIFA